MHTHTHTKDDEDDEDEEVIKPKRTYFCCLVGSNGKNGEVNDKKNETKRKFKMWSSLYLSLLDNFYVRRVMAQLLCVCAPPFSFDDCGGYPSNIRFVFLLFFCVLGVFA